MDWSIDGEGQVCNLRISAARRVDWEQWGLLTSDRHIDNPKSKHRMQQKHLSLAKDRGAFVIDCGDLICGMQGRDDPRGSKGDLKPENAQRDYLGSLVRETVDFFEPYSANMAIMGEGNHESAITKRREFDLTSAIVDRLRDKGSPVVRGGYRGWVRFMLRDGLGSNPAIVMAVA